MKVPLRLPVFRLLAGAAMVIGYSSAYRGDTAICLADFQCASGWCDMGTGKCTAVIPDGQPCTVGLHESCENDRCTADGVCAKKEAVGGVCVVHEDCWESYCSENVCTEYLPRWNNNDALREDQCQADFQCGSHLCTANPKRCTFQSSEGAICGRNEDCLENRCNNGQCIGRKPLNGTCIIDDDCLSLRCENQDSTGKNGVCEEPFFVGQTGCDEPSDCYMQLCNPETTTCVATVDEVPAGAPIGTVPGQPNAGGGTSGGGTSGGGAIMQDDGSHKSGALSLVHSCVMILSLAVAAVVQALA